MNEDERDAAEAPAEVDARRLRTMGRVGGVGVLLTVALVAATALAGAPGRVGAAIFLLLGAATCAVVATYGVLTAVRDDLRDVRVSRGRVLWVVALFVAGAALMAMTAGVGG